MPFKIFGVLLLVLGLPSLRSQAQQTRFMEFKDGNRRNPYVYVLGADPSGVYVFRYGQTDRLLEKYKFDLELIYSVELGEDPRSGSIEDVTMLEGKPTIFYSTLSDDKKVQTLSAFSLDAQGKPGKSFAVMVDSMQGLKGRNTYRVLQSKNRRHSVVIHQVEVERGKWRFEAAFQDANGFGAIQRPLESTPSEFTSVRYIDLDDKGRAWMLLKLEPHGENTTRTSPGFQAVAITPSNVRTFPIETQEGFLSDARIAMDNENDVAQIVGFYSEKRTGSVGGVFFTDISYDSLNIQSIRKSPLPQELVAKLSGLRDPERNQEPSDFILKSLSPTTSGGVTMTAEMEFLSTRSIPQNYNGFSGYRDVTYYHYRDLMLCNLDSVGKFTWWSVISKDQVANNPGEFSSFAPMVQPDGLALLFNETPFARSSVLQAIVDSAGNARVALLAGSEAGEVMIVPEGGKQISAKTILLPAVKAKRFGLLKVSYP